MAFLMAMFGILFWGAVFFNDRMSTQEADRWLAANEKRRKEWDDKVIDLELEREIRHGMDVDYMHYYESALSTIREIFNNDRIDFLSGYEYEYYINASILYLELIKHGKLPKLSFGEAYSILDLRINMEPTIALDAKFHKWQEDMMALNGVDNARIYHEKKSYADRTNISYYWEAYVIDLEGSVRSIDALNN